MRKLFVAQFPKFGDSIYARVELRFVLVEEVFLFGKIQIIFLQIVVKLVQCFGIIFANDCLKVMDVDNTKLLGVWCVVVHPCFVHSNETE